MTRKESPPHLPSSNGSVTPSATGSYNHSLMMGSVGSGSGSGSGSNFGIKFDTDDTVSMLDGTNSASMPRMELSNINGAMKVKEDPALSNYDAAEAAVAKLGSIMGETHQVSNTASMHLQQLYNYEGGRNEQDQATADDASISSSAMGNGLKRKSISSLDDADGKKGKKKKNLTNERREERNMREKERSLKITTQIHELRTLLSMGGVIVPKGTKSTILTEAANYIRLLQQHQQRSEIEKQQLVQEVQRIGNGAIGQKAAVAIRHVAAQNGVYSVANLGEGSQMGDVPQAVGSSGVEPTPDSVLSDTLQDREYRSVFNSCSVGMAIATMGGSFIDCNIAFTELSSYTKQELKAMTIFNLTSREDLQGAFEMMSTLITPPSPGGLDADGNNVEESKEQAPVILGSSIRHRTDLGLSVSLIRADDGVARYFNVTLVKMSPSQMGLGSIRPIPATADMLADVTGQQRPVLQQSMDNMIPPQGMKKQMFQGMGNTPQYTAG